MNEPLTSYEDDYYEYEIHHPTKPLILSEGNKWSSRFKNRLVFETKDEAFNNFYDGWFNSVFNTREIKE